MVRSPESDRSIISDFAPYSTSISIFDYHIAANGNIANTLNDLTAIQTTWNHRVRPLVTITNLTPEGFSPERVHQVLNSPTSRTNLVGSEPGPVAPITDVRRTVEFAIRYVPRRKIIIGVPFYTGMIGLFRIVQTELPQPFLIKMLWKQP